jgi:hypothetical protein
MPDVLEFYDKLTTTWQRIRADIVSHALAALLLWLIGFDPPLPEADLADFGALQSHPIFPAIQGVGLVALASLALAFGLAVYAVFLREAGRLPVSLLMLLFPPQLSLGRVRSIIPRSALARIAGTLDPHERDPSAVERRLGELMARYSTNQPDEMRRLLESHEETKRDALTYFGNSAAFLVIWILAPLLLPEDSRWAMAISDVFWPGVLALGLYVLLARARLVLQLRLTLALSAMAVATLIEKDEEFAARLAEARADPEAVNELVDRYRRDGAREESEPSLRAYLIARFGRKARAAMARRRERPGPMRRAIDDLRRFGRAADQADYADPNWVFKYLGWCGVRCLDRLHNAGKAMLQALGLGRF